MVYFSLFTWKSVKETTIVKKGDDKRIVNKIKTDLDKQKILILSGVW